MIAFPEFPVAPSTTIFMSAVVTVADVALYKLKTA